MTNPFYSWGAKSASDKGSPLGYFNEQEAKVHADNMNRLLLEWEVNPIWNKAFWSTKPEPWTYFKLDKER